MIEKPIEERNAPPGCIAVEPVSVEDGAGTCHGCCFTSLHEEGCSLDIARSIKYSPCWAEGRPDGRDVIFKESFEGEEDA